MISIFEALAGLYFLTYTISMWVSFGFLPALVGAVVYIIVAWVIYRISKWIKPPKKAANDEKVYHAVNDIRGEYYKLRMDNKISQEQYTTAEQALNKLWAKVK